MAKLIGTAGHVDHGKTSLIRALTGIDADRLPEEQARGMTIDIGFAFVELPGVGRVSIVDVPGHERFIANMLVGAVGVDVALLCVAADEGVKPQTREHFQILTLLPVERLVVALTRADLADADTISLASEEVRELLAASRFCDAPIVPVSSVTGHGLDELKGQLAEAMAEPSQPRNGPWYLPIDRAFTVKGHGVVVTGSPTQGSIRVGDKVFVEPGGIEARVRAIHTHGEATEEAERGKRTAINLGGVKLEDIRRGMAVGAPGAIFETTIFDATMVWLTEPKHGLRVRVSVGAEEAMGRVFLSREDASLAQFRLETPVACALDQPVVVRRYSPPDVLGGGRITVPVAKRRRRSEETTVVEGADDYARLMGLLATSAEGIATQELTRQLGKTPQALGEVFEQLQASGKIIGFAGWWIASERFEEAAERLIEAVKSLHAKHPMQAAVAREQAVHLAGLPWAGKPLDRILARLATEGRLVVSGTLVRYPGHTIALTDRQAALLERVEGVFAMAGLQVPSPIDVARELSVPPQAVEEIVRLGIEAGKFVRVGDGLVYPLETLKNLIVTGRNHFGDKRFTASEFKDAVGASRKYAIPLLEYLDARRVTLRQGDHRVFQRPS